MSTYQKPVATQIDTAAEGIYMASGATAGGSGSGISVKVSKGDEQSWGDNGQTNFKVSLKGELGKRIKLTLTFNKEITNAWGGGGSCEISSPKAVFDIYSPSDNFEISVQGKTGLDVTDSYAEQVD